MRSILVSALAAILILAPCAGCKKEKKEDVAMTISAVVGQVCLNVRSNAAKIGSTVGPGDRIITGNDSMAVLVLPRHSGIKVYENTDFLVTAALLDGNGDAAEARFDLNGGRAFLSIEKLAKNRNITVTSPTAVASVRGTSFLVEVSSAEDGKKEVSTGVSVVNGTVEVTARNAPKETRSVTEGSMVVMAGDRVVEDTKEIPAGELGSLKEQEKEIASSIGGTPEQQETGAREDTKAGGAPPVLKSEQAIKEYYHKLEEVNLDDGSTLIGAVIYQDASSARIHTTAGIVRVPTKSIITIRIR